MGLLTKISARGAFFASLGVAVLLGGLHQLIPAKLDVPTVTYTNQTETTILQLNWDSWLSEALITSSMIALIIAAAFAFAWQYLSKKA